MHFNWFIAWLVGGKGAQNLRHLAEFLSDDSSPLARLPLLFLFLILYGIYQHWKCRHT